MAPRDNVAFPLIYEVRWCAPVLEDLLREVCPGECTIPLNSCFDMASESELAELIQLGYDM